ncbi:MAG TPA: EboA family metabolite traffic protein [Rhodothermales bacterium]|nr:EboA family metabolite traffic protein [Rhodothermales bacterium]
MDGTVEQADVGRASELLTRWIGRRSDEKGLAWLREKRQQIAGGAPDRIFFTAFSAVPRYLGKADLSISDDDALEAESVRWGWRPRTWSVDQAARTLLLLALPAETDAYVQRINRIFPAADMGELVALYQSLPLLPYPELFIPRAAEGLRSSADPVFNAVALNNPFPADYLDEPAWNHLVLKAVFVGSPLHKIEALDRRANPELARMLVDYVHERWAASRTFTPELWRLVGRFADQAMLGDVEKALRSDHKLQREAAALALFDANNGEAKRILEKEPDLYQRLQSGELTWQSLSRQVA